MTMQLRQAGAILANQLGNVGLSLIVCPIVVRVAIATRLEGSAQRHDASFIRTDMLMQLVCWILSCQVRVSYEFDSCCSS